MKLNDAKPADVNKHILLLGRSGAGKTSLLKTAPAPIYVADFDCKGFDTLAGCDGELDAYDGAEAWAAFVKKIDELEKECPFRTVAWDSLSLSGDSVVEWAKKANGNNSFRVSPEDWGRAIAEIKKQIRRLKKLPANLIVTAHFNVERDEQLGGLIWEPAIFGAKLPGQLPTFFNDVWLLKVAAKISGNKTEIIRSLQMTPDQRFDMLKNSGNGKWLAEEQPNITTLFDKLKKD